MEFVSIRDFRTKTTQIWDSLADDKEIIITNNGRPRAFLVNIPEGLFEEMLTGIRQAKDRIKQLQRHASEEPSTHERTSAEMKTAWQELRNMLSAIDGNGVSLEQMKAERRVAKYERVD